MSTTTGTRQSAPGAVLTETERARLIERCPAGQRWAFGDWLRGTRDLAGDPVGYGAGDLDPGQVRG
ncbi:hypothetical protein JOF29_006073 [Kribbella aluminosa]|uniref:Uncharacterized protein n=1 Tax=Kribbella aluminosa TaxID=416017 RepID=A0ABS4UTK1_9ACTN|nr:hypothetical protein [Kribbella aluminosa]MBP2354963.1 hypothetical protein [Kribbella aluminosa]